MSASFFRPFLTSFFALTSVSGFAQSAPSAEPKLVQFVVNGGLTFGGDTLATAVFSNGDKS